MSAFDDLRSTLANARPDAVCVWGTLDQLRAAVAEHDALRDAVRAYLATLPAEELNPRCSECGAEAERSINAGNALVCAEHGRRYFTTAPLPERVRMLRALAAMVAEPVAAEVTP